MTIYDEIGGAPSVTAAVDGFYTRVLDDPTLKGYFDGIDIGRLKGHQRAFIGAALGGPDSYLGRDMKAAHQGLDVTPVAFDSVIGHLVAVLAELGVPEPTIEQIGTKIAPLRDDIVADPRPV